MGWRTKNLWIRGDSFELWPVTPTGDTKGFKLYKRKNWPTWLPVRKVQSAGRTAKQRERTVWTTVAAVLESFLDEIVFIRLQSIQSHSSDTSCSKCVSQIFRSHQLILFKGVMTPIIGSPATGKSVSSASLV